MNRDRQKAHGIHYTPPELASFLAKVTLRHLPEGGERIELLDPACGSGGLLQAACEALACELRSKLVLYGFETDEDGLEQAKKRLIGCGTRGVELKALDFLTLEGIDSQTGGSRQRGLFDNDKSEYLGRFDAIIANPPYVRTQVLGSSKSQELAKRFALTGRVDLYHAFVKGMALALKPGGVLGLLTSNRFLTVKSGATLRQLLRSEFCLEEIYDMGDTKLFDAAVLPVIVVARKQTPNPQHYCAFDRVYEHRNGPASQSEYHNCESILNALLDRDIEGIVKTGKGIYQIERGSLLPDRSDDVWSLSTPESDQWLATVRSNQACVFDDLGVIRVGIKTTADVVFIRDDWEVLPTNQQPEHSLLRPLITHYIAGRWCWTESPGRTRVLYPHANKNGKRTVADLGDYPRAAEYLNVHRERLEGRKYVIDAGRQWYEIWVAHNPADWEKPKIVFPDIAELPRFFLDRTGAIVNGDCYWITVKDGINDESLLLMLAVANSSFITKYYDVVFHNKLYAGRRRFMTQYVKEFPVPHVDSRYGKELIETTSELLKDPNNSAKEAKVDELVWRSFGLRKEV